MLLLRLYASGLQAVINVAKKGILKKTLNTVTIRASGVL